MVPVPTVDAEQHAPLGDARLCRRAGGRTVGRGLAVAGGRERDRGAEPHQEGREPGVAAPAPARPLARSLDNRLDLGLARDAERRGDGSRWEALADGATIASTMADVKLDRDDPLELHKQVAAQLRREIA